MDSFPYLINLSNYTIQNLSLERPKNNCPVLNGIHNKALSWLNDPRTDSINRRNGNDKTVLSSTVAFHLCV